MNKQSRCKKCGRYTFGGGTFMGLNGYVCMFCANKELAASGSPNRYGRGKKI